MGLDQELADAKAVVTSLCRRLEIEQYDGIAFSVDDPSGFARWEARLDRVRAPEARPLAGAGPGVEAFALALAGLGVEAFALRAERDAARAVLGKLAAELADGDVTNDHAASLAAIARRACE